MCSGLFCVPADYRQRRVYGSLLLRHTLHPPAGAAVSAAFGLHSSRKSPLWLQVSAEARILTAIFMNCATFFRGFCQPFWPPCYGRTGKSLHTACRLCGDRQGTDFSDPTTVPLVRRGLMEGLEGLVEPLCKHHWRIESPAGACSHAVCRVCGAEREFRNSESEHPYRLQRGKRS